MFEKFGEFDSAEEMNRAAAAQKAEGDKEALLALAKENGIDLEDAKDYWEGHVDSLCTVRSAALAKLELEQEDLKLSGVLKDWVAEIADMAIGDDALAAGIRRKGKSLAEYIARTAEEGFNHRCVVDPRIVNLTKEVRRVAGGHEFAIGIPDRRTRKKLILDYYGGNS